MSTLKYQAEISCSPAQLWPWLDEPERIRQWMKGVEYDRPTNDVKGVGATFEMGIREGRKITEYQGRVVQYEENRLLGIELEGGCVSGSKMRVQYELEDLGGRTRLDYACSFEATSLWMKLLSPVFKIMGRMMVRGFFKRLKSLAEAPQVDAAGASS